MKYRQALKCWHCQQEYTFPLPKEKVTSFIAPCPYCESEGVVDLSEYDPSRDMFRGNRDEDESSDFNGYLLPNLIKTKKNDQ